MQKILRKDFKEQYQIEQEARSFGGNNKTRATLYTSDLTWLKQFAGKPMKIERIDAEGDYTINNPSIGQKTGIAYLYSEMFEN